MRFSVHRGQQRSHRMFVVLRHENAVVSSDRILEISKTFDSHDKRLLSINEKDIPLHIELQTLRARLTKHSANIDVVINNAKG